LIRSLRRGSSIAPPRRATPPPRVLVHSKNGGIATSRLLHRGIFLLRKCGSDPNPDGTATWPPTNAGPVTQGQQLPQTRDPRVGGCRRLVTDRYGLRAVLMPYRRCRLCSQAESHHRRLVRRTLPHASPLVDLGVVGVAFPLCSSTSWPKPYHPCWPCALLKWRRGGGPAVPYRNRNVGSVATHAHANLHLTCA
jgi:hypothetical protein